MRGWAFPGQQLSLVSKALHGRMNPPLFLKLEQKCCLWWCGRPQTSAPFLGKLLHPLVPVVLPTQCFPVCAPKLHISLLTTLSFPGTQQI